MTLTDQYAQNKIFSQKTTNKVLMYFLAYCAKLEKAWEYLQSYDDEPFFGQNDQIFLNKFFFREAVNISSTCLLALFIVQNYKTIFAVDPELWGCTSLKQPICPKQEFFLEKPLI